VVDELDIVDHNDLIIGRDLRRNVHGDPTKIHRVAHVLVFNSRGELYLQKRSYLKDVQPGKWDTSVGGHLDPGEDYQDGAVREMEEELGFRVVRLDFLYKYFHENALESEFVSTFTCVWDGVVKPDPQEIEEGRFWKLSEIDSAPDGQFTPNFLDELFRYRKWKKKAV